MDILNAHPQLLWFFHAALILGILGQLSVLLAHGGREVGTSWQPLVMIAIMTVSAFHVMLPASETQRDWADALALMAIASGVAMPLVRWCVARSVRRAINAAARGEALD